MIEWISVRSRAIRKIGYKSTMNRMHIDFEDSDPYYTYCGVLQHVFQQFVSASSVGRFYQQYIRDQYNC
ncbi:MAG: KTSC domain-containing protein [gamma proteobacterium symbiont of Stewartia floridana]|nr:MAG: KTSC domain-containing protein [gamma proteobacterium symbiont of Stewartia floridana]